MDKIPYLAFLAPFFLFFQNIRSLIGSLFSFLIRNDTFGGQGIKVHQLVDYLQKNSKQIKFGNVLFHLDSFYVKQYQQWLPVFCKVQNKLFFLYKKKYPIILTFKENGCDLTYLNIFDFEEIIQNVMITGQQQEIDWNKNKLTQVHYIVEKRGTSLKTGQSSGNSPSQGKESTLFTTISSGGNDQNNYPFKNISLQYFNTAPAVLYKQDELSFSTPFTEKTKYIFSNQGKYMLNQVKNWQNSKDWYKDRDIRWYRGALLYGKPGTGKSALILQIAKELNMPIYIYDLSTFDNEEFSSSFNSIEYGSIILFEDLDSVFDKRVNLHKSEIFSGLSFDCFINKLSGVNGLKNCFVFITTNYIEKLDEALIRDGRIDDKVEIEPLSKEIKYYIARRMLDLWPDEIDKIVTDEEETAAQFENKCTRKALELYWKNK